MIDRPETVTPAWVRDQVTQIADGVAAGRHSKASLHLIRDELEARVVEAIRHGACEDVDGCRRALLGLNDITFPSADNPNWRSAGDSYFETDGERTFNVVAGRGPKTSGPSRKGGNEH